MTDRPKKRSASIYKHGRLKTRNEMDEDKIAFDKMPNIIKNKSFDELLTESVPLSEALIDNIKELTAGVEIDLDEPLQPKDDESSMTSGPESLDKIWNDVKTAHATTEEKRKELFNTVCAGIMGVDRYNPYDIPDQLDDVLRFLKDNYSLTPAGSSVHAARQLVMWFDENSDKYPKIEKTENHPYVEAAGESFVNFGLHRIGFDVSGSMSDTIGGIPYTTGDRSEWDEFVEESTEFTYPDVKVQQEKFNAQCRDIMFKHSANQGGSLLMLAKDFDPYYNGTQLINVFEIVLKYLHPGMYFSIAGQANTEELTIPHGGDVTWHMRKFIETYGTDEWIPLPLSEEEKFNSLCAELVEVFGIEDCLPIDDEFFDPWNNIQDLSPILPLIIEYMPEYPFKIPGVLHDNAIPLKERGNLDLHANMVFYVQCYGRDAIERAEVDFIK